MSGVTINGKKYDSIEDYMEEINPTIVEGNTADWEYTEEDNGTITLTQYLNTDTTIDTIVIPNYIDGKPVKKVLGGGIEYVDSTTLRYKSIWNDAICSENETVVEYMVQTRCAKENTNVKKIVVSEGIEYVGKYAFVLTTSLKEIKLPSTLKYVGEYMLAFCSELTKITIPNGVISIEEKAFRNCKGLTKVMMPNDLTNIEYEAFAGCEKLTEIIIPDSVTSIGRLAFFGCLELADITIPSSVITMMERVFDQIPLITVHVPWEEGKKPDVWNDNWNSTSSDCKIEVVYAE